MSIRIANLRLPISAPETVLPEHLAARLGVAPPDLSRWRILKKSLDARSSAALQFVYTVLIDLPTEVEQSTTVRSRVRDDAAWYSPPAFDDPEPGRQPLPHRPVVVGSGPAGLLAGYYLAQKGYRPIILERGRPVKERVPACRTFDRGGEFDRENNYLFGEGGAGCFSDGKLTCRLEGPDVEWVLERFVDCGGRPSIVYENRPHLGSNKLPMICRNFRRKIEALGGEYCFGCLVEQLETCDGRMVGLQTTQGHWSTSQVIFGVGHSARDTYQMLYDRGVPLVQKPFQLGLRIEQPQEQINRHKYQRAEDFAILGAADYTLQARGVRDIYTFCMCAGGIIMPSISEPERFCSNGMSNSRHDTPFANSGVMITLEPAEFGSDHPLAGMHLQREYESAAFDLARRTYHTPIQSAGEFLTQKTPAAGTHYACSYERGLCPMPLDAILPPVVVRAIRAGLPALDQKLRGSFLKNAVLVGPEMRGSAPVRMPRDTVSRESPWAQGLYPVGEGAGYAGGIISAAVDGLRSAREIVRRYAPCTV
jgi:uncharacterized protein